MMDHLCTLVFFLSDFEDTEHDSFGQFVWVVMGSAALSGYDHAAVAASPLAPFHNGALCISKVPGCFSGAVTEQHEVDCISSDLREAGVVGVWAYTYDSRGWGDSKLLNHDIKLTFNINRVILANSTEVHTQRTSSGSRRAKP